MPEEGDWQALYGGVLKKKMASLSAAAGEPGAKTKDKEVFIDVYGLTGGQTRSLRGPFFPSSLVSEIRRAIKDELDPDFKDEKSILYDGSPLDDGSTLESCGFDGTLPLYMVTITARMRGGASLPSKAPTYALPHVFDPKKFPKLKTCVKPDDLMCIDSRDDPRVLASCGKHRFTGETYYQLARAMVRDDQHTHVLRCPMPGCGVELPFLHWSKAAMLTKGEIRFFQVHITARKMSPTHRDCPSCERLCERPESLDYTRVNCGKPGCGDFCFACGGRWTGTGFQVCGNTTCSTTQIQKAIECAQMIKMLGGHECPQIRACPRCLTMIEWMEACKHFTCPTCKFDFCFLCLKEAKEACKKTKFTDFCELAPRQTIR